MVAWRWHGFTGLMLVAPCSTKTLHLTRCLVHLSFVLFHLSGCEEVHDCVEHGLSRQLVDANHCDDALAERGSPALHQHWEWAARLREYKRRVLPGRWTPWGQQMERGVERGKGRCCEGYVQNGGFFVCCFFFWRQSFPPRYKCCAVQKVGDGPSSPPGCRQDLAQDGRCNKHSWIE